MHQAEVQDRGAPLASYWREEISAISQNNANNTGFNIGLHLSSIKILGGHDEGGKVMECCCCRATRLSCSFSGAEHLKSMCIL